MYWELASDAFRFKITITNPPDVITKHVILSDISHLFDQIEILTPIGISAKILMQKLWVMKEQGCYEPVPETTKEKFIQYWKSLNSLNDLIVDRRVLSGRPNQVYELLHGFSDASEGLSGPACTYKLLRKMA